MDSNCKVDNIFISVNKIPQEAVDVVDSMPEMVDRLEILPFTEADSLKSGHYIPVFDNSVQVADRCMTRFVKAYYELRCEEPNFYNWLNMAKKREFTELDFVKTFIVEMVAQQQFPENYPYANGIFNPTIVNEI